MKPYTGIPHYRSRKGILYYGAHKGSLFDRARAEVHYYRAHKEYLTQEFPIIDLTKGFFTYFRAHKGVLCYRAREGVLHSRKLRPFRGPLVRGLVLCSTGIEAVLERLLRAPGEGLGEAPEGSSGGPQGVELPSTFG